MNETVTPKVVGDCGEDEHFHITTFDVIVGFVVVFVFAYIVSGIIEWRKSSEES